MTFGSPGSSPQFGGQQPQQPGPGTGSGFGSGFGAPGNGGGFGSASAGSGFGQPDAPASAPGGNGGGFGASPSSGPAADHRRRVATPTAPTKGPWPLLIASGVSAVLALIVLVLAPILAEPTDGLFFGLAIGGWVLTGIVAFVLLGLYTLKNTQRQAETFYIEDTTQTLLYRVTMGGSLILVIAAAVEIAFYVGKAVGA